MLVLISFGDIVDVFMSSLRRQTLKITRSVYVVNKTLLHSHRDTCRIQIYIRY